MDRNDADFFARLLYRMVITESGFAHPENYEEMLRIFLSNGADVVHCPYLPKELPGVSIGETVYINTNAEVSESQRKRFLAHEFAHFMRRDATLWPRRIRFYRLVDGRLSRDDEEQIARAFERLF